MPIYTRKGDKGTTSTFRNPQTRISKASAIFEAIGNIDELNSFLGIVIAQTENSLLKDKLTEVQNNLLKIGSQLAGSKVRISKNQIIKMEKDIDKMTSTMPVLRNFVFPLGTRDSVNLQFARALSRRAERGVVALNTNQKKGEEIVHSNVLKYLNRLSDYLFTLARKANFDMGIKDKIWKTSKITKKS